MFGPNWQGAHGRRIRSALQRALRPSNPGTACDAAAAMLHVKTPAALEAAIVAALAGRSIVLVGMMGAGKSSVGRRLAARLGLSFADADAEIEAAAGMTIPEIFAA